MSMLAKKILQTSVAYKIIIFQQIGMRYFT